MIRWSVIVMFCLAPLAGCGSSSEPVATPAVEVTKTAITLCGKCGHEKGSEECCAEGCTVCEKCGLHAGSAGCCSMKPGDDVTLCDCGFVKGSDQCCQEGAEKCADCGFCKGSPACKAAMPMTKADAPTATTPAG